MRIILVPSAELTPAERQQIDAVETLCFPPGRPGADWAYAPSEWMLCVWEGSDLAAALEIVERTIQVGGQPLHVGGVGGVMSAPAYRGRGCAKLALRVAAGFLFEQMAVEAGLLICDEHLIPFYGSVGWQVAPGPMQYSQPGGRTLIFELDHDGPDACRAALAAGADRPERAAVVRPILRL